MPETSVISWYVKASLGAEWGPLTTEMLLDLSDSGAFASNDLARCGTESDWVPLPDVIEKCRAPSSGNANRHLPQNDPNTLCAENLVTSSNVSSASTTSVGSTQFVPQPEWSCEGVVDWESPTVAQVLATNDMPFVNAKVDDPGENIVWKTPHDIEAATNPDLLLERLDDWKQKRQALLERLNQVVADREAAEALAKDAARTESAKKASVVEDHSVSEPTPDVPGSLRSATAIHEAVAPETWEQTLNRWRRSLPDVRLVGVVMIAIVATWQLWPVSHSGIASTYQDMYFELVRLRAQSDNKTGLQEFVEASQKQLEELIPWLEKRASPRDPQMQWLFWMGRDGLRPMLKSPRTRASKAEANFKKLMTEWHKRFASNPAESWDRSGVNDEGDELTISAPSAHSAAAASNSDR